MLNSTFYLAGIFLVLFCTAGFSGSFTSDSAIDSEGYSDVVTSYTVLPLSAESSTTSFKMQTEVCVLPGDAGTREKVKFADCLADSDCGNWKRYEDSGNGNVAAICEPT